ncbi:MAG: hypothetical protein SVM86_07770 [Candidatus Cloacimonadota bacterium]|nr:hypothetical protein [Candidatus Cloacimonadota bacterium]
MEKPEEAKNIAQENYKTPEDKIEIPYKNKAGKSLYKHNNNFFQDMKNNWQFSSNKNESFFPNTIESLSNNKKRIEK